MTGTKTPATRTPGPAPMFSSSTGDWHTPPEIVEAVRDLFGGTIDLDPCEVSGRLKFSGCKAPAPFPSVLFYLGDEVQRFADVFARFGVLVAPLPAAREAEEVSA